MSESVSDVLIVGGGIIGASAAFFLRRRGRSVRLLERGLIGAQASGVNFGNVRRQGRPLSELPLANRASETWRNFHALTGADTEYLQGGHLRVCYRGQVELEDRLSHYAEQARPLGLELELLNGAALRHRFPFLGAEVAMGSFSPLDGHANPRLAAPLLARAAQREGAAIHEHCEVQAVGKVGTDFVAEIADGRRFRAPALLLCAGAWSHTLAAQLGRPVPMIARAPTMSVTEPLPYAIPMAVGVFTQREIESVYFRQIPRGNIIVGGSTRGTDTAAQFPAKVLPANSRSQMQQLMRLAPALAQVNIIRVWTGVEGYLPDDQPVIGADPAMSGLHHAFGFCGSGFQLGPGVGETMAELIATGATAIDLGRCGIARFSPHSAEWAQTV